MTEERFKAWYHGVLAAASLAEVFTAKTNLRKSLLLLAAGWHAHCVAEHLRDEPEAWKRYVASEEPWVVPDPKRIDKIALENWGQRFTFPDHPIIPRKTVVFEDDHCTAQEEMQKRWEDTPGGERYINRQVSSSSRGQADKDRTAYEDYSNKGC